MFLFLLGLLLIPIAIVYLIITLIKKTFSKKFFWMMFISGFVLLIMGVIITPSETSDEAEEPIEKQEEQKEEESVRINVEIELEKVIEDGKVRFEGTTNLPDEAELSVMLSNDDGYRAQSKAIVEEGSFETEQFSSQGEQLESGIYTVNVSMGIASTQSKAVQAVLGKDSKHLTGDLIEDGELGKSVHYMKTIEIDGAEKIDHKALINEFKEEIHKHYENINTVYEAQRKSFDPATWSAFAREFREKTSLLKDDIESSGLNTSERLEVGPAVTNLQFLLTAYAAELQGRGDTNEINRLKEEVIQVIDN